ncbi:hypothetical protein V8B97DRAFT_2074920 [Scleroderma yunnanense]
MSLSFAGISLFSPWTPFYNWDNDLHPRSGFRSFVCALVFITVLLILAYLTNPAEASFRTYLTELSFRQHLSHLDDLIDDSGTDIKYTSAPSRSRGSAAGISLDRTTLPFHFANRASVSLRTPKHVLHSFGICTIATTRGAAATAGGHGGTTLNGAEHGTPVSLDTWFIGAFGHWWRGGMVDSWCYDAIVRSKDAEGWSSGILGFKASDKFDEYNGLLFPKSGPCPRLLQRGVPPKLRSRERSVQYTGLLPRRNSTPPPLPKSASLPLHADHRLQEHLPGASPSPPIGIERRRSGIQTSPVVHPVSHHCSASNASDHSPVITEVLEQIAIVQASVNDVKAQLKEAQTSAIQSHTQLEAELDDLRTKKREDDQKRADGKARTKSLEEARRVAETRKREAEKKLKVARGTKASATRRVEELESEIGKLKQRIDRDRAALSTESSADAEEEQSLISELETKKEEVRVAEEIVAALNARARELEEKIIESKARLLRAEELPAKNDTLLGSFGSNHGIYDPTDVYAWSSSYKPFDLPPDMAPEPENHLGGVRPGSANSPNSMQLSVRSFSGFDITTSDSRDSTTGTYSVFNDDMPVHHGSASLSTSHEPSLHGYNQAPALFPLDIQSPTSAFIPSSLISVLDSPSEDWRGSYLGDTDRMSSSPVPFTTLPSSELDTDLGPHEVGLHSQTPSRPIYDQMVLPYRTSSDPTANVSDDLHSNMALGSTESVPRRWFSTSAKEKPRKGLNPDAKVFRLPRCKLGSSGTDTSATDMNSHSTLPSYSTLNPTGLVSGITPSTPSSLLRAFAPSRAEREALQRALSVSTNTSLELLPSLSDVGSIPPSPKHANTGRETKTIGEKECSLPAWLQSLPLIRKPNFSPWEDEDAALTKPSGL